MSLPEIGGVVADRYRLEAPLGSGASASVFRAFDATLVRSVAIKFLFAGPERRRDELGERFQREARLAAAVDHPNVMRTLDFGTSEGRAFMVMELLQGQTLAARLALQPRLEPVEAVEIMLGVLAGLGAVHRAGIVHRDLKPENVYLAEEGAVMRPKVMDFGVSRVAQKPRAGVRSALTSQDGMIIGTPEYMSPEQARGLKEIDARSDLYSAGVLLFELLTDSLPYEAESMADLLVKIAQGGAPSPAARQPDLPAGLCAVVMQAMAHEPGRRFSDARAMANALCSVMGLPPQVLARGTVEKFVRAASSPSSAGGVAAQRALADAATVSAPVRALGGARSRQPALFESAALADLSDVLEPNRAASLPIAELPRLQTQVAHLQGAYDELQLDVAEAPVRVRRVAGAAEPRQAVGMARSEAGIGRRRGARGFPTGWVLLALVVGGLGYRQLGAEQRERLLDQARRLAGGTGTAEGPAAAPVNARIKIRLQGVPASAVVVLDGTLQQTTTELDLPADGALHYLEVRQHGMRTWSTSFEGLRDHSFAVMLISERRRRR
jgi:serine/threonine protein kinase